MKKLSISPIRTELKIHQDRVIEIRKKKKILNRQIW